MHENVTLFVKLCFNLFQCPAHSICPTACTGGVCSTSTTRSIRICYTTAGSRLRNSICCSTCSCCYSIHLFSSCPSGKFAMTYNRIFFLKALGFFKNQQCIAGINSFLLLCKHAFTINIAFLGQSFTSSVSSPPTLNSKFNVRQNECQAAAAVPSMYQPAREALSLIVHFFH